MAKKMSLVIAALAVLIAAGSALYFFVLRDTGEKPPERYDYAIKDPFVTNVKSSQKLFKATVVLVVDKKDMKETLDDNQYTIRDTILFMLRDLEEADIRSSDIQDRLRETIPKALNTALEIDNIVSVRFSDFVMQ